MRTINLQTVYQLIITALLLGACLGLLSQRLPVLIGRELPVFEQPVVAASAASQLRVADAPASTTPQKATTIQAPALAPGDTAWQTTRQENGRAVVYKQAPEAPDEFMLTEQTQFAERIVPRLFLYIYEREEGLSDYTVRIYKDGRALPVTQTSVAGLPRFTWPIPAERQRYTNLKIEFPHITPAGFWEVQLIDARGQAVGPMATFRLQPDDTNQEMYLTYRKL
jgi:hypothetical protein